jgi:uncharacterized protein YkwD
MKPILLALLVTACGPDEPAPLNPGSPIDPVAGPVTPAPDESSVPTPDPSPPAPSVETNEFVAAHNAVRAKHCAPPLTWSPAIASVARKWADRLAGMGCNTLEHSRGKLGENLAAATAGSMSDGDVTKMWYGEIASYDFRRPGFSMETGHFTQVVWKGTTQLGCASATCASGWQIWVCNYDPPGNVQTMYEENVLPTSCK